jgi:hypothetical protein
MPAKLPEGVQALSQPSADRADPRDDEIAAVRRDGVLVQESRSPHHGNEGAG